MGKLNCKACSEKQSQRDVIKSEHDNTDEQDEEHEDSSNDQMSIKNKPFLSNNVKNTNNALCNYNNNNMKNCVSLDNNINSMIIRINLMKIQVI